MVNEYAIESIAKEKVNTWLHQAEADRLVTLATAGQEAAVPRFGHLMRKVGMAFASAYRTIVNPPATPIDLPFGHAG